jgi:hypothetical protein
MNRILARSLAVTAGGLVLAGLVTPDPGLFPVAAGCIVAGVIVSR